MKFEPQGTFVSTFFRWIYGVGNVKQIINDHGSNLISRLNKMFQHVMEIYSKQIFAYSQWVDGKAESRMKPINREEVTNNYYRELVGL